MKFSEQFQKQLDDLQEQIINSITSNIADNIAFKDSLLADEHNDEDYITGLTEDNKVITEYEGEETLHDLKDFSVSILINILEVLESGEYLIVEPE